MENLKIGKKAPDFEAESTHGRIKISDFIGNWIVFFSCADDFTPVCTSELIEFSKMSEEFYNRGVQLLGLSRDSITSNLAWIYAIKMSSDIEITFPLISDSRHEISDMYNMLSHDNKTVGNVYLINPDGIICSILMYPKTTGMNVEEILRILTSLQLSESAGVVTPANWKMNQAAMLPPPDNYNDLLFREADMDGEFQDCSDWYMCYK